MVVGEVYVEPAEFVLSLIRRFLGGMHRRRTRTYVLDVNAIADGQICLMRQKIDGDDL